MRSLISSLAALLLWSGSLWAQETIKLPLADGFECPVGKGATKTYYKARGFRPNGHLGEDWNGAGGGDSDLGDPVFATAIGLVVFARDYRVGWGNVIILRHVYLENGKTFYVDSLYGHLNEILIREGQTVARGQKIGTIGNNRGMYDAHLHFELRKDIRVGMFRNSFPRDFSTYWDPTQFIANHQTLAGAGLVVSVPVNTFPAVAPPQSGSTYVEAPLRRPSTTVNRSGTSFKVDRFGEISETPIPIR